MVIGMNILVIDIGTSSMRGILYRKDGKKLYVKQVKYQPTYHADGGVEQEPHDFEKALVSIVDTYAKGLEVDGAEIGAVVITSQRSSIIPLDKDGKPVHSAIMWQDTRNKEICKRLEVENKRIIELSRAKVNCVFSGGKMSWFKSEYPEKYKKTSRFVNIPEYLIHLMTGKYVTDYTYGSRSNLMNIRTCQWDEDLLNLFCIDKEQLCELRMPGEICGYIQREFASLTGLKEGIPVISAGGDQQCGAVGHGVFKSGSCSVTTGTGAYLIATVDSVPEYLSEDIICNYSAVKEKYILECSVLTCCSAFDWYIRNFYDWKKPDYDAINFALSKKYSRRSSCMVLPYFQGRGTPDWNATANATFHKINLGHDREDILKALLEGIFVEIDNNMDNLRKYVDITQASISGGLANSRIMNQMQADVYGIPLSRLKDTEATANGAFMIGAVSMGLCESLDKAFEQILQYTEKENYSVNMEMHRNYIELKKEMKQLYKKLY